MTHEDIQTQLAYVPVVENKTVLPTAHVVIGGMGGSALGAEALVFLDPTLPIKIYRGYGLPQHDDGSALHIAISHSGTTEEALSFAQAAKEKNVPIAAIASGGALIAFAKDAGIPFVQIPPSGQPRNALMYLCRAVSTLIGREDLLTVLERAAFDEDAAQKDAERLAAAITGALPIFYASDKNGFLARLARINMNETAKMPSFDNVFPELNHNEMQSYDTAAPEEVAALARFILITDSDDDPRIIKRMDIFAELMRERGRSVTELSLIGNSRAEKLIRFWYTAQRSAGALAQKRGIDPDSVPLVVDFKKRL